jgi:hypothetical protein
MTRQQVFDAVFCHFGAVWAALNGWKSVPKHPQVGRMYGPIPKHKNKPLSKSLRPFL